MTDDVSYRHTPEMGEISGFAEAGDPQGIKYEATCNDMLEAGCNWLNDHPNAELKIGDIPNVTGLVWTEGEAKELEDVIIKASEGEATGAMVHTILARLFFIKHNGWDEYVRQVTEYPGDE